MSKKSIKVFCYSCDLEFTVKVSEDEDKVEVSYCVFCGDEIEQEQDVPEDSEEDDKDENDRWG